MGSLEGAHIIEDCNGFVQLYSDGSVVRSTDIPFPIPIVKDSNIHFKDFLYNSKHNLHLRVFRPRSCSKQLPIIVFIHGGGFCVGSRAWPNFHNCCLRLCSSLQALVVSFDYRLAPEHRLPAAYDDAYALMDWLKAKAKAKAKDDLQVWFDGVDFDRVFVVGDSSGGNIAHHFAFRLGFGSPELSPLRVRGYVLLSPFFGGVDRTPSELGPSESILNLDILDRFWRLSLPEGETREHPYAKPRVEEGRVDPPMLVVAGENELLKDRVKDYANMLKTMGKKKIYYEEFERQEHGFFTYDPHSQPSNRFLQLFKDFMLQCL